MSVFDNSVFSACYAIGFPGVVAVTWGTGETAGSAYAHFFAEPQGDGMGGIDLTSRAISLRGLASDLGTLTPGQRLTIDGVSYQIAAGPLADGHGEVTLYLDRARAVIPPEED